MAVRQNTYNGKWMADVVVGTKADGTRDRRTKTCNTKKQAQEAERVFFIEKERNKGKAITDITLAEFIEHIYWKQKKNLRGDTIRGYKRDIKLRLIPAFGDKRIDTINRVDIQKMIDTCKTRSVATNARETLSSILSLAVEMDIIDKNPAGYRFNYPKRELITPGGGGDILSNFSQHRQVLEYVHEHSAGKPIEKILVLGLCFGLRKGEIFGLDWEDIDLKNREIQINKTYVCVEGGAKMEEPKTPESRRLVPMTEWAYQRISEWSEIDNTGPVIKTGYRKRMNPRTGYCCLQTYIKNNPTLKDGTPFPRLTIQSCRHSFGTAAIEGGIEVAKVSKWMGHTDITTTYNRYVKPRMKDLHDSASAIDAAFSA